MKHDSYSVPGRAVLLAIVGSLAIFSLALSPVLAQEEVQAEPSGGDSEMPKQKETSPVLPEERTFFEQKLREWESEQKNLHEKLTAAVESSDRIETYYILKQLHGGGAGVDGSEFELRTAEIRERRKVLAEREAELRRMRAFAKSAQDYPQLRGNYQEHLKILETRVARQQQTIAKLEREALEYAEKAIVEELPIIFTLLSGGRLSDRDEDTADSVSVEVNDRRR